MLRNTKFKIINKNVLLLFIVVDNYKFYVIKIYSLIKKPY